MIIDPSQACPDTTHSPRYRWCKIEYPRWTCPDCDKAREAEITKEQR